MATYDGINIFGLAVKMAHALNPTAEQVNAFFGLSGQQSLWGGQRGRVFEVSGVFYGETLADLNDAEALYLSYIDGIARDLVDTRERNWSSVLVKALQPGDRMLRDGRGYFLPYKGMLIGLR